MVLSSLLQLQTFLCSDTFHWKDANFARGWDCILLSTIRKIFQPHSERSRLNFCHVTSPCYFYQYPLLSFHNPSANSSLKMRYTFLASPQTPWQQQDKDYHPVSPLPHLTYSSLSQNQRLEKISKNHQVQLSPPCHVNLSPPCPLNHVCQCYIYTFKSGSNTVPQL